MNKKFIIPTVILVLLVVGAVAVSQYSKPELLIIAYNREELSQEGIQIIADLAQQYPTLVESTADTIILQGEAARILNETPKAMIYSAGQVAVKAGNIYKYNIE